jgi:hypothetical protein
MFHLLPLAFKLRSDFVILWLITSKRAARCSNVLGRTLEQRQEFHCFDNLNALVW